MAQAGLITSKLFVIVSEDLIALGNELSVPDFGPGVSDLIV